MRKNLRYVRKHKVVRCADECRQNIAISEPEFARIEVKNLNEMLLF
jgi:hypothetical protein